MEQTKRCSRCKLELPLSQMRKQARHKGGYDSWCKKCFREYAKSYWKKRRGDNPPKRSPNGTGRQLFMAQTKECQSCGKVFGPYVSPKGQWVSPKKRKYCSYECYTKERRFEKPRYSRACKGCHKRFETHEKYRKFCSEACFHNSGSPTTENGWRVRVIRGSNAVPAISCEHCGATKHLHRHHKDQDIKNYNRDNIMILCAKCHQAEHRRLGGRIGRKPKITGKNIAIALDRTIKHKDKLRLLGITSMTLRSFLEKHPIA